MGSEMCIRDRENNLEVIQQAYDMGEKDAHIRMKALKDWMNLPEV